MSFATFALGAVVLGVAYMVPILGIITWALTSVMAMGAAAVMVRRRVRREQQGRRRAAATPVEPGAPSFPVTGERGSGAPGEAPAFTHASAEPIADTAYASTGSGRAGFEDAGFSDAGRPLDPSAPVEPPPFAGTPPIGSSSAGVLGNLPFPPATFLDRVAAFALDCLLVAIVMALLDLSRRDGAFPLLLLAYHIAFWTWKGTTLGGVVVGLRVARTGGQELRFIDALVRGLSGLFSIAALGIGCFWMLYDPARQMWHDKIAGTHVLKVPREIVLQEI